MVQVFPKGYDKVVATISGSDGEDQSYCPRQLRGGRRVMSNVVMILSALYL